MDCVYLFFLRLMFVLLIAISFILAGFVCMVSFIHSSSVVLDYPGWGCAGFTAAPIEHWVEHQFINRLTGMFVGGGRKETEELQGNQSGRGRNVQKPGLKRSVSQQQYPGCHRAAVPHK